MADFSVNILLRARDEASPVIKSLLGQSRQLRGAFAGGAGRGGGRFFAGANLAGAASGVQQLTTLAKGAIAAPIELAANFESALLRVDAFSGGTLSLAGNLQNVEKRARELGSTTEFTATEAADAFAVLTQAGFTYEEQMASIETVLDFATAGQIDLAKSAGIVGAALGGFGKDAKEATDITNVMARTATLTQSGITELGQAFKVVAPVSKDLGISVRDTAAALGVLGKSGIKGGEAGTALRAIFGKLAAPTTGNQKKVLRALGISREQMRQAVESGDLANPLQLLNDSLEKKGIRGARRTSVLKAFFGERRFGQASLLLKSVGKDAEGTGSSLGFFQEKLADVEGALDTMATTMRSGTKASGKELKSALEELGITAGQELLPVLNPLIDDAKVAAKEFAQWARENPELVKTMGKVLIGVVAVGTVLAPLLLTLSSMNSLLGLGSVAMRIFGSQTVISGVGGMLQFIGTAGKFNPAVATMIGSRAGFLGTLGLAAAAGVAGFMFGQWLDETFGLSNELSGFNTQLSVSNSLIADNIRLSIGRAKVRGAAKLGDLTEVERKDLERAQKRKEELQKELDETVIPDTARVLLGPAGFALPGRSENAINEEIAKQNALIDRTNQRALKRQQEASGRTGVGGFPGVDTNQLLGEADAATARALDNLTTGVPIDAGGEIKVTIDDKRAKVTDVKSGDIPISVEAGLTLEGG